MHGDLSQNQRDLVMKSFRIKQIKILVATDVASRGIDVENITHIIHYKIPDEVEIYNHRSGRTGRASNTGMSVLFITSSDKRKIKSIENKLKIKIKSSDLPSKNEVFENQIKAYFEKIHKTPINAELKPFLSTINQDLSIISKEDLIAKITSLEFERKLNTLKQDDVNKSDKKTVRDLRYQINLGTKDYYNWQNLKDFLTEICSLNPGDIYNVDVQKTKSFFNSKPEHKDLIFNVFNKLEIDERPIRVNITNKGAKKTNPHYIIKKGVLEKEKERSLKGQREIFRWI